MGWKAFKKNQQRVAYTRKLKLGTIHEIMSKTISCRQKAIDLMFTDSAIIRDWVKMYKKYGEEGIEDTYSRAINEYIEYYNYIRIVNRLECHPLNTD